MNITDGALALAQAGWFVFPVRADDKRPRTAHGHLDATTDEVKILSWANRFDRGGAIATPTGNGLLVVDVDPRNGGSHPVWAPPTRTVKTQSGGWHLHYRVNEDIRSRAGMFGRGVDSKSKGGYVLLPPSPGYEWLDLRPRTFLPANFVRDHMTRESIERDGMARLAPAKWHRGIIHDQVVAWAAYFAGVMDDETAVAQATWGIVQAARDAGVGIDNARGHIDSAIGWVLARESTPDVD